MEELTEEKKEVVIRKISELMNISIDLIKPEMELKDNLGIDSLDVIELISELEEEFDCSIPDEDYEYARTVNDIFKIISNRI